MAERLYTEYPELYDAIQSAWPYDRDVDFVADVLGEYEIDGERLLEVGCGTGEHTRRFVAAGFDVTAVDKYAGMLEVAADKCQADFHRTALPDLDVAGEYDAVVMIRGVVNHLPPEALCDSLETLADQLTPGGVLVFDNARLPPAGNHPALDVGTTDGGDYARIAQQVPLGDRRLEWREVVFTPDGDFFVNSRGMTAFEDDTITDALAESGFTVDTVEGYGPDDRRTVFIARS